MRRLLLVFLFCAMSVATFAQVRIAAHRGFWQSEAAGGAENSIASLAAAQSAGIWGSEFDVHLTADDVIVVNHDNDIDGVPIHTSPYDSLSGLRLRNGEKVPVLDEYLAQGEKGSTMLVLEVKNHGDSLRSVRLAAASIEALKARGLYDPQRVMFISFSYPACCYLAEVAKGFTVQYLRGDKTPAELCKAGISGIDYNVGVLYEHPEWVGQAHELGMSVNVWTVNKEEPIRDMIELGVDCITTNEPLLVREILGGREVRARAY